MPNKQPVTLRVYARPVNNDYLEDCIIFSTAYFIGRDAQHRPLYYDTNRKEVVFGEVFTPAH